jgi:hypothetical protein
MTYGTHFMFLPTIPVTSVIPFIFDDPILLLRSSGVIFTQLRFVTTLLALPIAY